MNFFLDDNQQITKFEGMLAGRKFEVTGTLDQASHAIHVESIKPLN